MEDPALVLDEVAVITTIGCESRRGERASLAEALAAFRNVIWMQDPADDGLPENRGIKPSPLLSY